jgi:hypothetical protein
MAKHKLAMLNAKGNSVTNKEPYGNIHIGQVKNPALN